MNTSKLADISEIISSAAILITLIFLTIQMQQNTQAIQASTRQAALDADNQYIVAAINYPEMLLTFTKPKLTDEEVARLEMSLILFTRNRENDFEQYQRGVMDAASWTRYRSAISSVYRYQRTRNWWSNFGVLAFNPEFVEEMNRILEDTPVTQESITNILRERHGSL